MRSCSPEATCAQAKMWRACWPSAACDRASLACTGRKTMKRKARNRSRWRARPCSSVVSRLRNPPLATCSTAVPTGNPGDRLRLSWKALNRRSRLDKSQLIRVCLRYCYNQSLGFLIDFEQNFRFFKIPFENLNISSSQLEMLHEILLG